MLDVGREAVFVLLKVSSPLMLLGLGLVLLCGGRSTERERDEDAGPARDRLET